jgi:hypothetical protein
MPGLRVRVVFLSLILSVFAASSPAQQVTARLQGVVTDATGALVPGASLVATNVSTGVATRVASDTSGQYTFATLVSGTYTLTIEKPGFTTKAISGITLDVDQRATMDVSLQVGHLTQEVQVQGAAPLVDTTTAGLGTTISEQPILDLPLNLRRTGALATLVPATIDTTGRSLTSANGNGSGFNDNSFSGSGSRSAGNLILIDGMVSRALNNGGFALQPVPEMVKEFKIQSNNYDAAFGLSSGATMNLITQSGTNQFHGSAWEYVRNQIFDARNFFAVNQTNPISGAEIPGTAKPSYKRNQFGVAVGGPIRKDRTFIFGSYEGLRLIQGQTGTAVVPTAAEKGGDFSSYLTGKTANLCASSGTAAPANLNFDTGQLFNPASEQLYTCPQNPATPNVAPATVLLGTPIPQNKITSIDSVGQKVLALYPVPNSPGVTNYVNQTPLRRPDEQFDVRADENLSSKDVIFARYLFGNTNQLFPQAIPFFNQYQHFRGQNVVGGWTRTFSSSLVNDVRIGYQRDYLDLDCAGCPRKPGLLASFGIQNLAAPSPQFEAYPVFYFSNFAGVGDGSYFPDILTDRVWKVEDTVTKVHGKHTLAMGADLNFWSAPGVEDPKQANGTIGFNGQYSSLGFESPGVSTVADLADLEQGYPDAGLFTEHAFQNHLVGGGWFSLFAQDNFRLAPRLSLELGLRWEYRKSPHDTNNQLATIFPLSNSFTPGDALLVTPLPAAQNDALCSDPFFLNAEGQCLVMSSAMRAQRGLTGGKLSELSFGPGHGNFDPRLGVSWRVTNSGNVVAHVGGGIFNDLPITNVISSFVNNNPVNTRTPNYVTSPTAPPPLINGKPTTTETMFANAPALSLAGAYSQLMPPPFYHTPTVYEWSASVQTQFAPNWALELGYVGNRGVHLDYIHLLGNQAVPGTSANLQPRRPYPDFNQLLYDTFDGISRYNALTVKLTHRYSRNFQSLVSYTYSKVLDWNGGDTDFQNLVQNDNNPRADYGVADLNLKQRLVISGIWLLPLGRGQTYLNNGRVANVLLGGWEVSGIIQLQDGFPFTVLSNVDYSNTGSTSPRPDRVCNGAGSQTVAAWFNTSCFSTTALEQASQSGSPRFGNSGKNILTGPGLHEWDLSLIKKNQLTEKLRLELRFEFFNIFNTANFSTPGNWTINTSTAGVITSAATPRDIQFGIKLDF